ncbi:MAG: FKBP-type peptidyl-prolyl cis-trans isomerase [Cytophagaceae bacterium]
MIRHLLFSLCIPLALLSSCGDGYKKSETGLEYKFFVDSVGATAGVGEAILLDVLIRDEKDSVLEHSFGTSALVEDPKFKGGLEEGFLMLSPGDSASFKVNADSFFNINLNKERPEYLKEGSKLTFDLKLHKIYSKEEVAADKAKYQKMLEEQKQNQIAAVDHFMHSLADSSAVQKQMKVDDVIIRQYMKENKLSMNKTEFGVYFQVNEGLGKATANPGDTLTVHYSGKTLKGKTFDSSQDREPYTFILGMGEVIPGWDDVMRNLAEGDKATFIIPSSFAYMNVGIPDPSNPDEYLIPKNAPLLFEVEIVQVSK